MALYNAASLAFEKGAGAFWIELNVLSFVVPILATVFGIFGIIKIYKKKEIEDSLLSWGASVEEPFSVWLYLLLALAFIGITIIFITYVNSRRKGNDRTVLNGNNY